MKTLWLLVKRTVQEYGDDNCSHMAAAISYYVLFSIIPLAIFLISIFGLVVRDEELQEDVAADIVDFLNVESGVPKLELDRDAVEARYGAEAFDEIDEALTDLTEPATEALATTVEAGELVTIAGFELGGEQLSVHPDNVVIDTIQGVSDVSGALTIVGLVGMAWSASAMFGAIRKSLNIAWDTEVHRPVVQQKLTDLGMVFGLGLLLGLSVAGTAALRTLQTLSDENLGPLSEGTGFFWAVLPLFLPAIFSFTVFMLIYRYVPNAPSSYRDVWPGALLATVLFEVLKNAFAIYIANFNSYAGAYGVLGGLLLFLLWTYLTSNILLIGAELASEYPRVLRGDYDEETPAEPQAKRPVSETVRRAVRGLFLPPRDEPEEPPGDDETPS
ncbi:MAG: YihY/virulence factor BrkB family protein [Chloroflexi bacterium]|nr:YihY/virulence factor BrkB family protein [Chloroflexota bacterium]